MSVALAANALTTTALVEAVLGLASNATNDDLVNAAINAASQRIEDYLDRKLYKTASLSESVAGFGGVFLRLARTPILSVASVAFDGNALASTDYSIHDADAGLLYRDSGWANTAPFMSSIAPDRVAGSEKKLYTVVYDGGFTLPKDGSYTLPEDIKRTCEDLAVLLYRSRTRDLTVQSEKLLSYSATYVGAGGIYDAVQSVLATVKPYMRLEVV